MAKIKILFVLTLLFIAGSIWQTIYDLQYTYKLQGEDLSSVHWIFLLMIVLVITTTGSIAYALFAIMKKGYFNTTSPKYLSIGGILILIGGILTLTQTSYLFFSAPSGMIRMGDVVQTGFTVLVGFGIITLGDILKKGAIMRQENDLTI